MMTVKTTNMTLILLAAAASTLLACEKTSTSSPKGEESASSTVGAAPKDSAASSGETLGFVISDWREAIPRDVEGGCPDGLNPTEYAYYEVDRKKFRARAKEIGLDKAEMESFGGDACKDRSQQGDPGFKTFQGQATVRALDLDGRSSQSSDGGACAHDDFADGTDNQMWRLWGCTTGHQPDGLADRMYESGNFIREGIPMLIEITGVDDRMNDEEVEVRLLSSADTLSIDSNGNVVPQLSLRAHAEERFRSKPAKGRIENGRLQTDPTDVRLRFKQQVIDNEFWYRDARLDAELLEDGSLRGVIGFYWDADNLFDVMNNHTIGQYHSGRIAAATRGYMCAGMNHALARVADGHPDPETGKCTSISGSNVFQAVPAFVISPDA